MRLASFDGRPADLGKKLSPELMPVVSDNYNNHLTWRGKDEIPAEQFQKLQALVQQVHKAVSYTHLDVYKRQVVSLWV